MASNPQAQGAIAPAASTTGTSPGLFEVLLRRSWFILLGALAGLGLAYLYFQLFPAQYVAKAQLLVERKRPDMVPGMERPGTSPVEDYVSTQVGMIKSPLVVGRAVRNGNLTALTTFQNSQDVTASLILALTVKRDLKDKANNIIDISFKGLEPEDCKKVLEAIIESYQQVLRESYQKVSEDTLKQLGAARDKLENDLLRKEGEYLVFRLQNPALRLKGTVIDNVHNEMLLNLHSKRMAVHTRRAEIEALLKKIEEGGKNALSHEELIALTSQLTSRGGSESGGRSQSSVLEDKLLPALIEERSLSVQFGPTHPQVLAARKQIESARTVVASVLNLELEETKTSEHALANQYKTQEEKAQQSIEPEVKETLLRDEIARIQLLSDGLLKLAQEINVTSNLGGYHAEAIGPPGAGELATQSKPLLIYPAAVLLGLLGCTGLAVVVPATRRKTFPGAEEIHARLGSPVVGRVPRIRPSWKVMRQAKKDALAAILCTHHQPNSPEAEAIRGIRTALFFNAGEEHQVIQITASNSGDGTSTLAANLAVSLAQAGKSTLLIDANLRRPSLHTLFGLDVKAGLASVLAEGVEVTTVIQDAGIATLSVLPAGPVPTNPAELLSSPRFQALLGSLREQYQFVVIDTPPLLSVTDAAVVAASVDAILLALSVSKKDPEHAERAKERLGGANARVLGVVLNGLKGRAAREHGYQGYR